MKYNNTRKYSPLDKHNSPSTVVRKSWITFVKRPDSIISIDCYDLRQTIVCREYVIIFLLLKVVDRQNMMSILLFIG